MSEQQRTRLYAWLCEQTDESLAEYLMTCLAPAPLSDLVTKDYLSAELSRFATKEELNAGFATQRAEARQRHFWLTGTVISVGLAVGAPVWLSAFGIIG